MSTYINGKKVIASVKLTPETQKMVQGLSGNTPLGPVKTTGAGVSISDKMRMDLLDEMAENDMKNGTGLYRFRYMDDIAPTKKKKEGNGLLDFFQAGAFEDGYQIGDVTKSILGTAADAGLNALKGGASLVEGVADLGAYGISAVADKVGAKRIANDTKAWAKENRIEEGLKPASELLDQYSLLGRTSDAVTQGLGQVGSIILTGGLGAAAGLGAAGTTALTTGVMGLSGIGSGIGEAYEEGATDKEAAIYGMISGGADALTELVFGGLGKAVNAAGLSYGLFSADDMLAKKVSGLFKSQIAKNLAEFGVKASAEGVEEVVAGIAQAIGKNLTYMKEEDLLDIVKDENLLEQFVVGAATSGMIQAGFIPGTKKGSLIEANKAGRDFITGFSQNEQAVIDKEIEKRIAEQETDGKKLTKRERSAIGEQVQKDLDRGYISIDTIEETLGGKAYEDYRKLSQQQEAVQKEFDSLNRMKQGEMTGEQVDRREELRKQLDQMKSDSRLETMRDQVGRDVFSIAENDRLSESYRERGRRSQAFEADLMKYDEKQRAVVQRAVESGILNNTNRTHDFVDMVAKLSADTGVLFDFTNNAKLKESGFAIDGKTVNGFVTKDGVTVNIQSAKALNTVVGHEISHVLEGTELYTELQNALFEYAKTKGEYQSRLDAITKLYEGVEGTDVNAELAADLVGDYLFTDSEFISRLSTKNRNVFQRIYDEIKYLVKVAKAGSKEARELERVKKLFDEAYRKGGKSQSAATQYSLNPVEAVQPKSGAWEVGASTEEVRSKHPTLYAVDEDATTERNPTQVKGTIGSYRKIYNFLQSEGFDGTILDASSGLGYGTKAGVDEYGFRVDDIEPYPDSSYKPKYTDYSKLDQKYDVIISNAVLNVLPQDQRDALVVKMGELLNDGGRMFINVRGKDVLNASGKIAINEANMEYFIPRTAKTGSYQKGFTKPELVAYLQDALGDGFTVTTTNMFGAVSAVVQKIGTSNPVFSLSYTTDNRPVAVIENDIFHGQFYDLSESERIKIVKEEIKGFRPGIPVSGRLITISRKSAEHFTNSDYTDKIRNNDPKLYEDKLNISQNIDDVVYASTDYVNEDLKHKRKDNITQFARGSVLLDIGGRQYEAGVLVGYTNMREMVLYDVQDLIPANFSIKSKKAQPKLAGNNPDTRKTVEPSSNVKVAQEVQNVKPQFSLSDTVDSSASEVKAVGATDYSSLSYDEITAEQNKLYSLELSLRDRKQKANNNPELKKAMDDVSGLFSELTELIRKRRNGSATQNELSRIEEIKNTRDEYISRVAEIQERIGLNEISKEEQRIRETKEALRKAADAAWEREGALKENNAIEKSGLSAEEYFRKKALKAFKTTSNFNEAGYMLPDGKMLNFSGGERNHRYRDHREIGEIYEATNGAAALNRFLNDGNIRIMAESPGIDIASGVEPTKEQYSAIKRFINSHGAAEGQFFIDFSGPDGERSGNYSYTGRVNAERVINDIKYFYETGKLRESSGLADFLSVSYADEKNKPTGSYNVYGKDIALEDAPVKETSGMNADVAPVASGETAVKIDKPVDAAVSQDAAGEIGPVMESDSNSLEVLRQLAKGMENAIDAAAQSGDYGTVYSIMPEYEALQGKIAAMDREESDYNAARLNSLDESDMPPEREPPYPGAPAYEISDPFDERDIVDVGRKRSVKAYQYENPEVKPFFRDAAYGMLTDLSETTKGERWYNDDVYYESGGENGFGGTKRNTTSDIAELLDTWGYTYEQIEKGLLAIIEDDGKENNAASKRIEFMLNDRLLNGYTTLRGEKIPANQEYIDFLTEKQIDEYRQEGVQDLFENADRYAPAEEDIAPVPENMEAKKDMPVNGVPFEELAPTYDASEGKGVLEGQRTLFDEEKSRNAPIAQILTEEQNTPQNKKSRLWALVKANLFDKGSVFEDLALKTNNRELIGKWNYTLYSEARAQRMIGNGAEGVRPLNDIISEVEGKGQTRQFYDYMYNMLNVDRMTLESRFPGETNKAVFGDSVTAEQSKAIAEAYERSHPEFKRYANDIYSYLNKLRDMMVENGVIAQETADLWSKMYPHYVPIRRVGETGLDVNIPLDTRRTGINAPIKKATGGNSDILPMFDTIAQRTIQTYKAIAKNNFGIELKNSLGSAIERSSVSVDDVIGSVDAQDQLLKKGENGRYPTFTVFENGQKVTFEITEDMYDAFAPLSHGSILNATIKPLNKASSFHRGLLTEYNPVFMLTNAIKDIQDVLINSQHTAKTYLKIPEAFSQLISKGYWYNEYMDNGGEQTSYFDSDTNTFRTENKGIAKLLDIPPLSTISKLNNVIEMTPRLAEYIASREAGRSVEVSMLDAARVTTNFAAGGNVTKFLNRNGATFLNASVQGAMQQVRNFREAKANGIVGWASLATKFIAAGLPAAMLNAFVWDDDDEYEELSDYIKENYYIIGKSDDGTFIRVPKGRTVAVIQNAYEQISNAVSGDDDVDFGNFLKLVVDNLAPNNPIDNNVIAPIIQAANNKTWYGGDLVPKRLQDFPEKEQYDASTDSFSKWLGEKLNISPMKINYLLNQYSGGVGDVVLPMLTPEAESGDNTITGKILSPLRDKFYADAVMDSRLASDFYDKKNELEINANSRDATDQDVLKKLYMSSANNEISELYKEQREIQDMDIPDSQKFGMVRDIKEKINDLSRSALETYDKVQIQGGNYAIIGGNRYNKDKDGNWWKISDEQFEKQNDITGALGISPSEYWRNRDEYTFAYEKPEMYSFLDERNVSVAEYKEFDDDTKEAYRWAKDNPDWLTVSKAITDDFVEYRKYTSEMWDLKADKDANGKTISGSKKKKVIAYINALDIGDGEKMVLFKSQYPADDSFNYEIIDYLNSREDISYQEMETILKRLDFKVDAQGNISW